AITDVIMTILGQIIGQPNFDSVGQFKITASATEYVQPGTIVTALVNFLLVAAAVYFAIVLPTNKLKERLAKQKAADEANEVTDVELLTEIRDLLATKR
ncbi:MscL family protein, partial [uncultured Actinomyces sp.]